jgi:hypothetical protein
LRIEHQLPGRPNLSPVTVLNELSELIQLSGPSLRVLVAGNSLILGNSSLIKGRETHVNARSRCIAMYGRKIYIIVNGTVNTTNY